MALTDVGCEVEALCPNGHPMLRSSVIRKHLLFHPLTPLRCIERAISKSSPEFIIPGDELAVLYLHRIHARSTGETRAVIERSLGDPAHYSLAHSCNKLMAVAQEEGVATPMTAEVPSPADIPAIAARFGLPLVLKADGTSGGQGVRVLSQTYGADAVWRSLRAPISIVRLIKRVLFDSDWNQVLPFLRRDTRVINAQSMISGSEANTVVACWQGEVLACISLEVVSVWYPHGPSSVVRVINDAAMAESSRKIVKRLKLSGFCGFDFIRDEHTGVPQMIEMNPRPTQLVHLQLGENRDLVTAWVGAASGRTLRARPAVTEKNLLAIFPHELHRDPSSPMLQDAYHDVPWSEPALVLSCMKKASTFSAWRPNLRWIGLRTRADLHKG
jgi:Carbamoyl-phosphate synthase L chain, ATP binding domain